MNTQSIIRAKGLSKHYKKGAVAVDHIDFTIETGRIVGLIGPNGAGKTSVLKAILGLTSFEGDLEVLGRDPRTSRDELMNDVCFIADVAVLPRWIRVAQVSHFVQQVHPRFNRERFEYFIKDTKLKPSMYVREMSKGMVVQLHLALVMAIDAKLLVLDEPTLGLDILYRKQFYQRLLQDYFDENKTIVITTHQVEEIEHILSDVIFIRNGKIILNDEMNNLAERYIELLVANEHLETARSLNPINESAQAFGRSVLLYDNADPAVLKSLGETRKPNLADLFVAYMKGTY